MKKPNLTLTAKDFERFIKADSLTKKEDLAIANDLKTLLEFMIENEDETNIDLSVFESDCGTYRCVAGWWCYFLGKRIIYGGDYTSFLMGVFADLGVLDKVFINHDFDWNDFFGINYYGTLQDRLDKTNKLIKAI